MMTRWKIPRPAGDPGASRLKRWVGACLLVLGAATAAGQQIPDPNFDVTVARPAANQTKVLFDEAHFNFHTTTGRYQSFARLLEHDGCVMTSNQQKFSRPTLAGYAVLVIANALGAANMGAAEAGNPAFTEEECLAVAAWVRAGGGLLLIADHSPMGAAAERLGRQFGVDMSKGYTSDPEHHAMESKNEGFLLFNRENGLLGEHAIMRGLLPNERISRVQSFTGQSLRGPDGSTVLLKLADTAIDVDRTTKSRTSAAGRAQGIALPFGEGRGVVMGEAAMLSAQLAGPEKRAMGMNQPGLDNKQLTLNIVHWLARILH